MTNTIFTAVEANDEGMHVWRVATRLAAQDQADLTGLNVVEPVVSVYADLNFTPLIECSTDWQTALIKERQTYFENHGVSRSQAIVTEGYPSQAIADHAKDVDPDLIVMGVHNRRGLKRMLGSTTHNVLNHTTQNLLAVHPDSNDEPYKRVLVAVDTSADAIDVLKQAASIAPDAESVHALTVIIPLAQILVTPETSQMGWSTAELSVDIREQTESKLKQHLASANSTNVELRLVEGDPRDEIIRAAEELKADLIVIGSANRGTVARLLLGSTARAVLNQTPCDVLVVRPD